MKPSSRISPPLGQPSLALSAAIAAGLACAACAACSKPADPAAGKRGGKGGKLEYPVDVAPLDVRQMQYTVTAPGSIDAFQQVQITARVAGAVDKVAFTEGQQVKSGDVLAVIESERYAIAVAQAQSAEHKADAALKAAQAALDRRLTATKDSPGLVPGEEIEQKQTAVDTAKADLESAQQALKVANLNLRDSSVRAPIAGIVQTRTVQQGQYLQAGAVLATILQRDPMLLRFQVTEQDAPRLEAGMAATLVLKESARQFTAKISLVGGAADPATRMVPVTAQVDDTDHQYWLRPGAFCEVTVPIGNARKGIVVPSLAVQPTEKGNVVYIVEKAGADEAGGGSPAGSGQAGQTRGSGHRGSGSGARDKASSGSAEGEAGGSGGREPDGYIAHAVVVELGMHTPEGGVELTRGVSAGELLVVRGIEPLTDGAPVKIGSTLTLEAATAPVDAGVGLPPPSVAPDTGSAGPAGPAGPAAAGSAAPAPASGSAAPAAGSSSASGSQAPADQRGSDAGSGHHHRKDAP